MSEPAHRLRHARSEEAAEATPAVEDTPGTEHPATEDTPADATTAETPAAETPAEASSPEAEADTAEEAPDVDEPVGEGRRAARSSAASPKSNPEPEDTGSAGDNWRRLKHAGALKWTKSQVLTGALCALLGFALVAQIQQTEEKGVTQLSQSDLVRVLGDLDSRNSRLQSEARDLQRAEDELQSGTDKRQAAQDQADSRARDLSVLAGTVPVQGPGIVLSINREGLNSATVVTLVQELRDAGAEAIEINNHRIVVDTWFGNDEDRNLLINGNPVDMPLTVTVIGEPDTMATAMKIPGGVSDTIEQGGGSLTIETRSSVDIDAVVPTN